MSVSPCAVVCSLCILAYDIVDSLELLSEAGGLLSTPSRPTLYRRYTEIGT
jgi:hypothetical protein